MLPRTLVVPRSPIRTTHMTTHIPLDNSPVISTPKLSCEPSQRAAGRRTPEAEGEPRASRRTRQLQRKVSRRGRAYP